MSISYEFISQANLEVQNHNIRDCQYHAHPKTIQTPFISMTTEKLFLIKSEDSIAPPFTLYHFDLLMITF